MSMLYFILATAGWIWLAAVFGYLGWRMTTRRKEPRGFDVQPTERKD